MKKLLTLLTFLIGFGAVGWSQSGAATVYQIIQNSSDHTTLTAALDATGLDAALSAPGPYTVFAPTDAAFDALGPGVVDALLAEPEGLLTDILLYHVVGSQALSGDLSDGQMITTLNGADVTVSLDGGVFINDAEVIVPDLPADNGVVHVVDAVLLPPVTVWDIVTGSDVHNTLEAAVIAAELDGALSDESASLTLFAPTDDAFAALPPGVLDGLLDDPSGLLTDILLYHVVGAEALSGDLADGQMITTLNGQDVTVTIDGGVFINDAEVIVADLPASNGVVHVIDAVLVPEAEAFTVWDIIMESEDHTTLEAAVLAAELDGALDDEAASLTVFAPTDAAFDALPAGLLDDLLDDPSGLLTQILLYHVVGSEALSGDLADGQMITTLNGQDVTVTIDGGVFINDAEVIIADLQADNGVVHVIDAVLVPEAEAFTVWDIIMESEDHTTLEAAVLAAELDGALDDEAASLTVFAPTDAAFDALPAGLLDDLLDDPSGLLTQILLYHVVGSEALSGDLADGQMITTLNGQDVTVTIDGGVFINDAEVIIADLQADNGVVHVIDAVLVPEAEAFTVWDIIMESEDHTTLEAAVLAAELDGALDDEAASLTVFAPTDAAFDALPAGLLDDLLDDPSGLLTQILLYHVVGSEALSGDLADGQMITTLNGQDVTVTIDGGVFINDAEVIVADLQADNGVVHVIDAVLVPEAEAFTVWDIIMESEDHNTLEAAVIAAELDGALDDEAASLTVFAPTDAAFDALPAGLLDDLLDDPTGLLTDILLYHVVGSEALSGDLSDGQMITTLNGQDVMVTIDGGVFINDAEVIIADLQADNGVVHVIDAVLVPEEEPCLEFIGGPYGNFNTLFDGAPVADENGVCPVNQITTFEAWASESYIVEGFQEGVEYTFSICEGPGAGSWDAELSVLDLDGNVIAFEEGCSITWTSPADGDYLIGINEVGACGDESANTDVDNGYPTLTCTGSSFTVWDIIQASPVHTTLETAVLAAGLEGALSGDGPLTVFAPTDDAFAALPDGMLDDLLDDPTGALTDVLLYHVVGSQALSGDLSDGQMITTLNGADVTVTIDGGVFINDAEVIVPDLTADNGVVHVIDAVLNPLVDSVDDLERVDVELFPNPSSGMVNVTLTDLPSVTGYQVVSATGAVVANGVLQPGYNTVDLSDLSKGLYLFQVFDDNGSKVERLVIQ